MCSIAALDPLGRLGHLLTVSDATIPFPSPFDFIEAANFVEVVHTSVLGIGHPVGDVDVYVNSAIVQPQCLTTEILLTLVKFCNQNRLICPPWNQLTKCATGAPCEKHMEILLLESVQSIPQGAAVLYSAKLYELLRRSQERAAFIYASSLRQHLNCQNGLNLKMCSCRDDQIVIVRFFFCTVIVLLVCFNCFHLELCRLSTKL